MLAEVRNITLMAAVMSEICAHFYDNKAALFWNDDFQSFHS